MYSFLLFTATTRCCLPCSTVPNCMTCANGPSCTTCFPNTYKDLSNSIYFTINPSCKWMRSLFGNFQLSHLQSWTCLHVLCLRLWFGLSQLYFFLYLKLQMDVLAVARFPTVSLVIMDLFARLVTQAMLWT